VGRRGMGSWWAATALLAASVVALSATPAAGQSAGPRPEPGVRPTISACPVDRVSSSATSGYTDIGGTTFEREINCLRDYGIAFGRSAGRYEPAGEVTRRQMALFLARLGRLSGGSEPDEPAPFTDLGGLDAAARSAVDFVAWHGIARGKGDGRFAPDEPVTRGQMATFLENLHHFIGVSGGFEPEVMDFIDVAHSVHRFAIEAIAGPGVAGGVEPGRYAPDRTVTRQQMAGFLTRVLDIKVAGGEAPWVYATPQDPSPPVYTSTGLRCTVVGTSQSETLTGTAGDDVLCGQEGSDIIEGVGGNDVLDSGPTGGTMRGGDGDDVLLAFGGPDQLEGGAGDDVLYGGNNSDTLLGEDGADLLYGEGHDDDLDGGPGADVLDGGGGVNLCAPSTEDEQRSCGYDDGAPTIVSMTVEPSQVDVTHGDVPITVRLHLRSGVGIAYEHSVYSWVPAPDGAQGEAPPGEERAMVQGPFGAGAELVSGSHRDGIYEATGVWPRGAHPGPVELRVRVRDEDQRLTEVRYPDAVTVVNSEVDTTAPQVVSATATSPTGFPVDVRSGAKQIDIETRLTDDRAGVRYPGACLYYPSEEGYRLQPACYTMSLVSGDDRDGVWRTTMWLGPDSVSGDWNLVITAEDRATNGDDVPWMGAQAYQDARERGDTRNRLLPGDGWRIPVVGEGSADPGAPGEITAVTVSHRQVDSRYADTYVRYAVHVVDPDGGSRLPWGRLRPADETQPELVPVDSHLVSGTPEDGWYEVVFFLRQGISPETYYPRIALSDARSSRSWYSPDDPRAFHDGENSLVLDAPVSVTVRWD
jgi:hypothetical protein